jgi:hypothetical protein
MISLCDSQKYGIKRVPKGYTFRAFGEWIVYPARKEVPHFRLSAYNVNWEFLTVARLKTCGNGQRKSNHDCGIPASAFASALAGIPNKGE